MGARLRRARTTGATGCGNRPIVTEFEARISFHASCSHVDSRQCGGTRSNEFAIDGRAHANSFNISHTPSPHLNATERLHVQFHHMLHLFLGWFFDFDVLVFVVVAIDAVLDPFDNLVATEHNHRHP